MATQKTHFIKESGVGIKLISLFHIIVIKESIQPNGRVYVYVNVMYGDDDDSLCNGSWPEEATGHALYVRSP